VSVAPERVDIAVIGAGPAGCATAIALARRGIGDVALFEAGTGDAPRIGETIPGAAMPLLSRLVLMDRFTARGHLPALGSTAVWGKAEPHHNDGFANPFGGGWHLDRADFDADLRAQAQAAGVPLRAGRLRMMSAEGSGHRLRFEGANGPFEVTAALVVDATGVRAAALRSLKVVRNAVDAIAFHWSLLALAEPEEMPARTLLEAVPEGWWYASRIPGGRVVVGLATDPDAGARFADADAFRAALAETRLIGPQIARCRPLGTDAPPHIAIAPTAILSAVAGPGWLAVGDAAACLDPLLSQGLTRALEDGNAAADAIAGAQAGDAGAFTAYQDRVFARFTAGVRLRAAFYAAETRWPDAPFWRRRHVRAAA
jgi:flavin-dependent dehydrogenase